MRSRPYLKKLQSFIRNTSSCIQDLSGDWSNSVISLGSTSNSVKIINMWYRDTKWTNANWKNEADKLAWSRVSQNYYLWKKSKTKNRAISAEHNKMRCACTKIKLEKPDLEWKPNYATPRTQGVAPGSPRVCWTCTKYRIWCLKSRLMCRRVWGQNREREGERESGRILFPMLNHLHWPP